MSYPAGCARRAECEQRDAVLTRLIDEKRRDLLRAEGELAGLERAHRLLGDDDTKEPRA